MGDDWNFVKIEQIAAPSPHALATGPFGSSIGSRYFQSSGIPIIRGGNLSSDPSIRLIDRDLVFLSNAKAAEFPRSTASAGDLVFTCWGTINQIGLIDGNAAYPRYVISNKQMKFTADPKQASSEFLYWMFSGPAMQREILAGSIGSSIPGFNLTRLRSLQILLPPLNEQRAIADTLGGADAGVRSEVRLHSKAVAVLDCLARDLLSGKRRIAGHTSSWRNRRVDDFAEALRGSGVSKSAVTPTGKHECLLYGELFTKYGRIIAGPMSRTNESGSVRSRAGDVLVPGSTTTVAEDLATASSVDRPGVVLGGDVNIIRPNRSEIDSDWLAYSLTFAAKPQIAAIAQGTTIVHLYARDLRGVSMDVPSVEEQQAVVAVLMDAQAEVEGAAMRIKKAIAVREGLMQELLSGRTRLPVEDGAA